MVPEEGDGTRGQSHDLQEAEMAEVLGAGRRCIMWFPALSVSSGPASVFIAQPGTAAPLMLEREELCSTARFSIRRNKRLRLPLGEILMVSDELLNQRPVSLFTH